MIVQQTCRQPSIRVEAETWFVAPIETTGQYQLDIIGSLYELARLC